MMQKPCSREADINTLSHNLKCHSPWAGKAIRVQIFFIYLIFVNDLHHIFINILSLSERSMHVWANRPFGKHLSILPVCWPDRCRSFGNGPQTYKLDHCKPNCRGSMTEYDYYYT